VEKLNLSDLLRNGMVEKFQSSSKQIEDTMRIAIRDVSAAKKNLEIAEWDWAHNIAFNAMLQAGRALMFWKGYRARGQEHHLAVTQFVAAVFPSEFSQETLSAFERGRKRRSAVTYDQPGTISETQARNIVALADDFVGKVTAIVRTR
jgi:uncharacterized protein (UPF0332 family)